MGEEFFLIAIGIADSPRPESYKEDFHLASELTSKADKTVLYTNMRSALHLVGILVADGIPKKMILDPPKLQISLL